MNKLFKTFCLIASIVAVSACEKSDNCESCDKQMQDNVYPVSLKVSGYLSDVTTKVADVTSNNEEKINSCRLYVFGEKGLVNKYDNVAGDFSFFLAGGTYDFVAVVNGSSLPDSPSSADDILGIETQLTGNAADAFYMSGSILDKEILQSTELDINVSRLVSKVTYSVKTDFANGFAPASFKIKSAYMTNVVTNARYGLSTNGLTLGWINKMGYVSTDNNALTYDVENKTMTDDDTYASNKTFYVYPNSSADSHDKTAWSVRKTRLVLEADYDGVTYYYPVTIPSVGNNNHYIVSVTVKGPGMTHPEDENSSMNSTNVSINVVGWQLGGTINASF